MRMILHHTQFFNLISTFLNLKNLPSFLSANQLWGDFPEVAKKLIIEYNKKVKVVNPKSFGGNPKPKPTWVNPIQSPSKSTFMRMTILLNILLLKSLLKAWCMSAYLMVELTHQTLTLSCQLLKPRVEYLLKNLLGKSKFTNDMSLPESINPPITWLIGEPM